MRKKRRRMKKKVPNKSYLSNFSLRFQKELCSILLWQIIQMYLSVKWKDQDDPTARHI
jgi:hypothetical protein